ncbi:HNH endonuclease [Streptomyces sp. NPDC048208]|uniref:HNH endonuclease n=1 Tax=Streptomyces sp. NPDC048208 TaxID=3365515 RepID=UPI0037178ADE
MFRCERPRGVLRPVPLDSCRASQRVRTRVAQGERRQSPCLPAGEPRQAASASARGPVPAPSGRPPTRDRGSVQPLARPQRNRRTRRTNRPPRAGRLLGSTRDSEHLPERLRERVARDRARRAAVSGRGTRDREPRSPVSKDELFSRWSYRCCYCDGPAEHIDHVTPISKGGDDVLANVVPACAPCNLDKAARSLTEWAETFWERQ